MFNNEHRRSKLKILSRSKKPIYSYFTMSGM